MSTLSSARYACDFTGHRNGGWVTGQTARNSFSSDPDFCNVFCPVFPVVLDSDISGTVDIGAYSTVQGVKLCPSSHTTHYLLGTGRVKHWQSPFGAHTSL